MKKISVAGCVTVTVIFFPSCSERQREKYREDSEPSRREGFQHLLVFEIVHKGTKSQFCGMPGDIEFMGCML